ncbi:hypothetical protein NUSPORA_01473 [Nucleospora cyclopteri]
MRETTEKLIRETIEKFIRETTEKLIRETTEKFIRELLVRVESLCKTKLNGKNLLNTINEHVIFLVNHHIGVLKTISF